MSKKKKREETASVGEKPAAGKDQVPHGESPVTSRPATDQLESGERGVPRVQLSRYISFGMLLAAVAVFVFFFYEVMASFLVPLFLAALLVVVFRPLHRWILEKVKGSQKLGALLTTAAILLVVLIPLSVLLLMAVVEAREFSSHFNSAKVVAGIDVVRSNLGLDMPAADQIRRIEMEIRDLQQMDEMSELAVDRHRSSLFEIEEAARSLAEATNRYWPSDQSVESTQANSNDDESEVQKEQNAEINPNDHWRLFLASLNRARALHYESSLPRLDNETDETSRERIKKAREYRRSLAEMSTQFAKFKTQLLGGKARAWLVETANPSGTEIEEYTSATVTYLRDKIFKIGGGAASYAGSTILGFAIMVIGLYFFLLDGPKMIETFKGLSPLEDDHEQELVTEFGKVSRAVVIATLLSALVQGFLAGIGFYFCGIESVFLLTVLTSVFAMIPFVGAAAVWFPCSLYLYFFENELTSAISLALYGALIVSMADNVIKPLVLHGQSNLHPMLALLSVLGGVATLGPIGILVGPMIVAFLQTLLEILQREISEIDQQENSIDQTASSA